MTQTGCRQLFCKKETTCSDKKEKINQPHIEDLHDAPVVRF